MVSRFRRRWLFRSSKTEASSRQSCLILCRVYAEVQPVIDGNSWHNLTYSKL